MTSRVTSEPAAVAVGEPLGTVQDDFREKGAEISQEPQRALKEDFEAKENFEEQSWHPPSGRPPEVCSLGVLPWAVAQDVLDGLGGGPRRAGTSSTAAVAAVEPLCAVKKSGNLNINEVVLVLGGARYRCANSERRQRLTGRESQPKCGRTRKRRNDLCVGLRPGRDPDQWG